MSARWIRFVPPPAILSWYGTRTRRDSFALYRTTFSLEAVPDEATCRVTADGRYLLMINGVRIGSGPARSEPAHRTFDRYQPASVLRTGRNVIAILARHYGGPVVHYKPEPIAGDLGFGAVALDLRAGETRIVTDAGWKALAAPYTTPDLDWPEGPPPMEVLDGRAMPAGWQMPGFDDGGWPQAHVCAPGDAFAAMQERSIGDLSESMLTPRPADGVLDLGSITVGHPMVIVDADPGTVIEVAAGEEIGSGGELIVAPRAWSMQYTARGDGEEAMESFEPVGLRFVEARVRRGHARSIKLSVRERFYPREPGAFFECSDPLLNALWETGARTVDRCSLDAIVDCPGREQRAWLGDQAVTALASMVGNPDSRLVRHTLRLHAQGARADGLLPMVAAGDFTDRQQTLPDFSLHWICAVRDVWRHTADVDLVDETLAVAERAIAFFERHRAPSGLLSGIPGWIFIDWAQTARDTHIAALDALFAFALEAFAELCEASGRPGPAAHARSRAQHSKDAMERYWDPGRGLYVDAIDAAGTPRRRVSQQTNAMALIAGCVPPERYGAIMDSILDGARVVVTKTPGDPGSFAERMGRQWERPEPFDEERNVVAAQPFFMHFVHRAMMLTGRHDALLDSIRRWKPLLDRGNGCFEEYWDAAPGLGSRCHAWSATPTYDLSAYVLGVRPAAPGFSLVSIKPFLGDLEYAEGAVPTPHGLIRVKATREDVSVTLPDGVTAARE